MMKISSYFWSTQREIRCLPCLSATKFPYSWYISIFHMMWAAWNNESHCPHIGGPKFEPLWQQPSALLTFLHTRHWGFVQGWFLWPLTSLWCWKSIKRNVSLGDQLSTVAALFFVVFQMVDISIWDETNFFFCQLWPHGVPLGSATACDLQRTQTSSSFRRRRLNRMRERLDRHGAVG